MGERRAAFDEFYDEHFAAVVRGVSAGVGIGVGAAEDATQEAFVRALVRWRRVGAMERPSGWVYVTAVRIALRARRDLSLADRPGLVHDQAEIVGDRLAVSDAVARLPERQRLAIVLRYFADLDLRSIASAMGCAVGTVKSTLHAALRQLEVALDDDPDRGGAVR
jgi:RNA polymerase sigma-70 factor, ECF subfamily